MVKWREANYCNLKLLLIFLVVYGHWIEPYIHQDEALLSQYRFIYFFHMPVFVFLSGLFLSDAAGCIRQVKRLAPIYIVCQGTAVLMGAATRVDKPYWVLWYHSGGVKMKLPCDIVQDLLPLYEDNLCSQASREAIEEHLQECESCGKQHTAVQKLAEPDVVVEPKKEKKATARSFKKIRNRWIASIVVILLLIPIGYLGWGQYQGSGPSFTNLHELYLGNQFMRCLEAGEYEKAFQYVSLDEKRNQWLQQWFTEDKMEHFEEDAKAKFVSLGEKLEQAGGIDEVKYLGIDVGGLSDGAIYYLVRFSLVFDGVRYRVEVTVSDKGVTSLLAGGRLFGNPLEELSIWSEYLWQDYSGCYFDPEFGNYVYYDESH